MRELPKGLTLRGTVYWISWYEGGERRREPAGRSLDRAIRLLNEKRRTGHPPKRGLSFARLVELYLDDVSDQHPDKPRTRVSARNGLAAPIKAFGTVSLNKLREEHWRAFVRSRRAEVVQATGKVVSPATVARDARYVRACLRWAVRQGYLSALPFEVKVKAPTQKKARSLDREQMKALLAAADDRTRPLIYLALNSGLRRGELVRLEWSDVDLAGGTLHVRAKADWTPKDHQERSVSLTDSAAAWLKAYRQTLPVNHDKAPVCQQDPTTGKAWSTTSGQLNEHVRRTFERAGLYKPELKPGLHLLRACYATLLLEGGASIETVRGLCGHCSVTVTERYLFSTPEGKRAAVKALDFLA